MRGAGLADFLFLLKEVDFADLGAQLISLCSRDLIHDVFHLFHQRGQDDVLSQLFGLQEVVQS